MKVIYDDFGNQKRIQKNKIKNNIEFKFDLVKKFSCKAEWITKTIYAKEILLRNLLKKGNLSQTTCITGHLHHGKSTFVNLLACSVHLINDKFLMDTFSDQFYIEKEKGLTLYPNIITLLMHSKRKNSRIFNFIDCPGHPDFQDQVINSMEISDGIILVLDLAEGVMIGTELPLRNAITRGLPIILTLNSIDRLVIELNISPNETHLRILNIIDDLNVIIQKILGLSGLKNKKQFKYFNPILNNVCFSSLIQGWTFTLEQFSEIYLSSQPSCCISSKNLVHLLWNCSSLLKKRGNFSIDFELHKSFLFQDLILFPLFKLIFFNLSENYLHIRKLIETELGIYGIGFKDFFISTERLLNLCLTLFLGGCRDTKLIYNHSGFINSLVNHISWNENKSRENSIKNLTLNETRTIGHVVNFSHQKNSGGTLALCKVLNGNVCIGDKVRVLTNENFFYSNQKYYSICKIKKIAISVSKYTINISTISMGILAFIKGFEFKIKKSGIFFSLVNFKLGFEFSYLSPGRNLINCRVEKLVKIIIKPTHIIDLHFLFKALRTCSSIYPNLSCQIKSNENIVLSSSSKFYLSCVLQDLKELSRQIDFQISDPYFPIKELFLDEKDFQSNLLSTGLILKIKRFQFLGQANFPILGFLGIYKKLLLRFPNIFFLLNSICGGYISSKLEKKQGLNKIKSNSIWFFDFDKIDCFDCFLTGNCELSFLKKKKKIICSEFKILFKKSQMLSDSLCKMEFFLVKKENSSNRFELNLFKRNMEKLQIKLPVFNYKQQESVFLGEIVFPEVYFPLILRFLKKKLALIISFDTYYERKIISIKIQISGVKILNFDHEISLITQGQSQGFFIFDKWKNSP